MEKKEILIFIIAIMLGIFTYFLLGRTMNASTLTLTSDSFTSGGTIPRTFTCDGENISPHFRWNALENQNLKSYVLIVDDPDAQSVVGKTFVHWIAVLSPTTTELAEGVSYNGASKLLEQDAQAKELRNDFGKTYYGGPCPPNGTHTYRCTLFATSEPIDAINNGPFTADQFRSHMGSKILAESSISASYSRTR